MILLVLLGMLVGVSDAIMCYDDIELDNVQDYIYRLEKKPLDKYWSKYVKPKVNENNEPVIQRYNMHLSYTIFGKFDGDPSDATITAGYYKQDNSLIYSIEVDCGAGMWRSYTPNVELPEETEKYQEGQLEESCGDGEIFDVILKVQQAHLMNWLYNGQALQEGSQNVTHRKNGERVVRERTLYVPSPDDRPRGGAADATKIKIQTTGSAVITRLAFGRCIAWPEEITRNCTAVNEWILKRSKSKTEGHILYGANVPTYQMDCYNETLYYWIQSKIRPDEKSMPETAYCCCVNMETGKLFTGDKNVDCQSSKFCTQTCTGAYDADLITGT